MNGWLLVIILLALLLLLFLVFFGSNNGKNVTTKPKTKIPSERYIQDDEKFLIIHSKKSLDDKVEILHKNLHKINEYLSNKYNIKVPKWELEITSEKSKFDLHDNSVTIKINVWNSKSDDYWTNDELTYLGTLALLSSVEKINPRLQLPDKIQLAEKIMKEIS